MLLSFVATVCPGANCCPRVLAREVDGSSCGLDSICHLWPLSASLVDDMAGLTLGGIAKRVISLHTVRPNVDPVRSFEVIR